MFQQLVNSNLNQTIQPSGLSSRSYDYGQWQGSYFNGNGFSCDTVTQIQCSMKHLRKQSKTVTRSSNVVGQPMPQVDPWQPLNDAAPRAPLSADPTPNDIDTPEEIAFRNYLKSHLPRFKASTALAERIRNNIAED
jgi:hypothetical protein